MDVERTLKRFPPSRILLKKKYRNYFCDCKDYSDADRNQLQEELIIVIIKILIKHDYLNYYQVNCFKIRK
jgi:hypothetical protein